MSTTLAIQDHVEIVKQGIAGKLKGGIPRKCSSRGWVSRVFQQRAIRQLHYDAFGRILFQCKLRFYEQDDGSLGGGTLIDLPIRNLYDTDHGRGTSRGVFLARYI